MPSTWAARPAPASTWSTSTWTAPTAQGTIIGGATYGLDRPDIAAQYGARFGPSGWELAWNTTGLAPGVHRLYLYAHRTTDNAWSLMDPHLVIVPGGPTRWLPIVLRQR
jgi:hypothetical protein